MKQFDYNSYMRNNPLLKEDLESDIRKDLEKVSGIDLKSDSSALAKIASKLYQKILDLHSYDIDDELVDATMEEIIGVGINYGASGAPELDKLKDDQLEKIIPFLKAVIKRGEFDRGDEWDGKKIVLGKDWEEDESTDL
jgi:hypothetical protein